MPRRSLRAVYVDESAWIAAHGARPRGVGLYSFRRWPERAAPVLRAPRLTYTMAVRWLHAELRTRWLNNETVYLEGGNDDRGSR
jgi:hypothetical protein